MFLGIFTCNTWMKMLHNIRLEEALARIDIRCGDTGDYKTNQHMKNRGFKFIIPIRYIVLSKYFLKKLGNICARIIGKGLKDSP